jgi:predicted deacetylase
MRPQYLLRFDDLCPMMNWEIWEQVEELLVEFGVRPILAVIPDNRDESLSFGQVATDFWDRVRRWQRRGWTIAIHGYQHTFITQQRGLFGWNDRSEFAGLPASEQEARIRAALGIFTSERIKPTVWVAPNHSFDDVTLEVLHDSGTRIVSDGLGLFPYLDQRGMFWIPLQTWSFEARRLGVWTVCLHHNRWTKRDVDAFRANLAKYGRGLTSVDELVASYGARRRGILDHAYAGQRRARRWLNVRRHSGLKSAVAESPRPG